MASLTGRIFKAMSVFSGVQVLNILCSIVRTKLIAVWIGPIGVGLFATFNSVVDMMSSTTQLNLRNSAIRDISAANSNKLTAIVGIVRRLALWLGILGAVLMLVLSPALSYFSFGNISQWWAFALLAIAIYAMAQTSAEYAVLQGTSQLRVLAKASIWAVIAATLVSIPLYYFLRLRSIVPSIIVFTLANWFAFKYLSPEKSCKPGFRETFDKGKDILKLGIYLTVSSFATTVASYAFISYLNRFGASDADTGLFQAGYTLIIRYTGIIFAALSMEFYPRVIKVAQKPRSSSVIVSHELLLMLMVITPMIIALVISDKLIMEILYRKDFIAGLPLVTIGIAGSYFRVISYGMAFMILARGDGRTYIITEVLSSCIGLLLNISMYRLYGFTGLGISYVLWYAIYTLITGVVYYFKYGMNLNRKVVFISLGCGVLIFAAIALKIAWGWVWALPVLAISTAMSCIIMHHQLRAKRLH